MTNTPGAATPGPLPVLKGFASLRRLAGTYPAGHPMLTQKLKELEDLIQQHLRVDPTLRIDIIRGDVFLDGVSFGRDDPASAQVARTRDLDRQHSRPAVSGATNCSRPPSFPADQGHARRAVEEQLARRNIRARQLKRSWRSIRAGARGDGGPRRRARSTRITPSRCWRRRRSTTCAGRNRSRDGP